MPCRPSDRAALAGDSDETSAATPIPPTRTSAKREQPDEDAVGQRTGHDAAADLDVAIGHVVDGVDPSGALGGWSRHAST